MPAATAALMPPGAVFDDEASIRADAELAGGEQKNVGMRFSPRHHVGAVDVAAEFGFQLQHRQAQLQPVDRTGGRDAPGQVGKPLDEIGGAADFLQIGPEPVQRRALELAGKIGR